MRGQSSLLNKSPNIRLQSFLTFIQKALDMNWESIYKDDGGCSAVGKLPFGATQNNNYEQ